MPQPHLRLGVRNLLRPLMHALNAAVPLLLQAHSPQSATVTNKLRTAVERQAAARTHKPLLGFYTHAALQHLHPACAMHQRPWLACTPRPISPSPPTCSTSISSASSLARAL